MEEFVKVLVENWEYVVIAILAIDKAVALSPSEWDDLLWTSVKKSIYKNTKIPISIIEKIKKQIK